MKKLTIKERRLVKEYANKLIREREMKVSNHYNEVELIGPSVDEMLDAIKSLNGYRSLKPGRTDFPYRNWAEITPENETGQKISNNKYSIFCFITLKVGQTLKEADYIRAVNSYLTKNGFKCKLYRAS